MLILFGILIGWAGCNIFNSLLKIAGWKVVFFIAKRKRNKKVKLKNNHQTAFAEWTTGY